MVRRLVSLLAACGVALGGLTLGVAPASAAAGDGVATSATVSPNQWQVNASEAVTVSWTNSVDTLTSVLVRSPWPWGASWSTDATGFSASGAVASGAQVITCTQGSASIVFTISSATTTGQPTCKYDNSAYWKGVWISGGGLSVSSSATISVSFPAGQVTAPSVARTDSWLVGGYYINYTPAKQAEPTITAVAVDSAGNPLPLITIDIDGNGGTCQTSKVTGYQGFWALAPGAGDCFQYGYTFKEFNTSADGSGLSIAPGGNLHLTNDNRLYAIYEAPRLSGPPTDVVAVAGRNQVTVSWKAPADPGTGPIMNYLVTANPSRKICITTPVGAAGGLNCTFDLPATNTSYNFTAQALNLAGWGPSSPASNAVSPFNVILDTAARTQDRFLGIFKAGSTLSVSGRGPGVAPGTVITPQVKIGSGDWVSETRDLPKVGADRSISWSKKLAKSLNGTPVQVRLTLGDVATDPASLKVGSRFGVPDAPQNVKVVPERGGVRLSWEAPDNDGGSPVTSYVARATVNGLTPSCRVAAGDPLTCVVPFNTSRVAAGATIPFTVTAVSTRGEGAPAKASFRGPLRWVDIRTLGTRGGPGGKAELSLGVQTNGFVVGDAFTVELKIGADGPWKKQKGRLVVSETRDLWGAGEWSGIVPDAAIEQGFTVRVANPMAAPDAWTKKPRP